MKKGNRKKAFGKSESAKPQKPHAGFPLNPHASGKWQKKIRGKCHYFGKWGRIVDGVMERIPGDGWEEALTIYKTQAEAIYSGKSGLLWAMPTTVSMMYIESILTTTVCWPLRITFVYG